MNNDKAYDITDKNWREPVEGDDRGTREALKHRGVERVSTKIDGAEVTINRTVSTLAEMYRKGNLTEDQHRVGLAFEDDFDRAHLDALRIPDLQRVGTGGGYREQDAPGFVYDARDRVYKTLDLVGGANSAGGRALWHIVGLRRSFREMQKLGQGSQYVWRGALVAALDVLVKNQQACEKRS